MVHKHVSDDDYVDPAYAGRLSHVPVPKNRMPEGEAPAEAVYRMIHDELLLDGSSRLNMATFVTTWMEPEAEKLMAETFDKNMIDKDEYPADRRDRAALCEHRRRSVPRADRRRRNRGVDDRLERGGHAGWAGDEVEVAPASRGRRPVDRQAEHGDGFERPGGVGEVLQVLGRRGPLCAGRRGPVHRRSRRRDGARRREHDRGDPDPRHDLHGRVRTDQGDPRPRRGLQRRARHRHPDPRRRRVAVGSWRRSCTRIWSGTFGCRR